AREALSFAGSGVKTVCALMTDPVRTRTVSRTGACDLANYTTYTALRFVHDVFEISRQCRVKPIPPPLSTDRDEIAAPAFWRPRFRPAGGAGPGAGRRRSVRSC